MAMLSSSLDNPVTKNIEEEQKEHAYTEGSVSNKSSSV